MSKDMEEIKETVNDKAYMTESSMEDQGHFSEDKGRLPEEVAAIVISNRTLSFLVDGSII